MKNNLLTRMDPTASLKSAETIKKPESWNQTEAPTGAFLFLRRFTMKKATNYTIAKESREDQFQHCRFNPGLEITFSDDKGRHKHKIASGYSDEIAVFQDNGTTLVLSHNRNWDMPGWKPSRAIRSSAKFFSSGMRCWQPSEKKTWNQLKWSVSSRNGCN